MTALNRQEGESDLREEERVLQYLYESAWVQRKQLGIVDYTFLLSKMGRSQQRVDVVNDSRTKAYGVFANTKEKYTTGEGG